MKKKERKSMIRRVTFTLAYLTSVVPLIQAASGPGVAENMTVEMTKLGSCVNKTNMTVGDRCQLQLEIQIPDVDTSLLVEVFTPDNETTVMVICDPQVTFVGSNLLDIDSTLNTVECVLDSKDGSRKVSIKFQRLTWAKYR